jgi:hypothetical protein
VDIHRLLEEHGVLLESAHGPVPSVAELVAGEQIRGSWWGHPKGEEIFRATRALRDAPDVVVTRLINGKITFVHRRLWPAVVRLASRFDTRRLAQVKDEHAAGGRHVASEVPFPRWVPEEVITVATAITEEDALNQLPVALRRAVQ